jgi:hypothetical protein
MRHREKSGDRRQDSGGTTALFIVGLLAFWITPATRGVETFVTFDVVTPDPNDGNYTAPLIEAEPNQQINYSITAIVYTDPNTHDCDANYTLGLGAAYVTLNTSFADPNCVREANSVSDALMTPLGTAGLGCTGLVFGDDVTDIGGSQDLLGEASTPNAFANGYKVVIATGTLTALYADGVYHVWVTPADNGTGTLSAGGGNGASPVSVLEPNLSQPPFGNPPDHITTGPGFYVARGTYYTLTLTVQNGGMGDIDVTPNQPGYAPGTGVILTATSHEGKEFLGWGMYDPNYPGDQNYYTTDTNSTLNLVMNANWQVDAAFKCDSGGDAMLPLGMVGVVGVLFLIRRLRLHS